MVVYVSTMQWCDGGGVYECTVQSAMEWWCT